MPIDPETAPDNLSDEEMAQLEAEYAVPAGPPTRQPVRLPHPGIGSLPFPSNMDEAMQQGEINREQSATMGAAMATGPGGVLRGLGTVGRIASNPFAVGAGTAGVGMAMGRSPRQAVWEGVLASLFAGPRIARAGRKFSEAMKRSAERFGRPVEEAVEGAMSVPGRTLTKPSAPPFLPKGKVRLDLGPTEQTTLTGTVGTSRPPTPKPVMSSTGSAPRGKVSQPNVSVRTEAAREAMAAPAGPAKAAAPGGPQSFTDEITSRIRELAREGRKRPDIARILQKEYGATPGQSATAMDAVLKRSRQ